MTLPHPWKNFSPDDRGWVYRMYDIETGILLYVGCTAQLRTRLAQHSIPQEFVELEVDEMTLIEAIAVEKEQIHSLRPLLNCEPPDGPEGHWEWRDRFRRHRLDGVRVCYGPRGTNTARQAKAAMTGAAQ